MDNIILAEIDKEKKLIDMMTSIHSDLSSRYKYRCLFLDVFLVLSSIILLSCVFIDQSLLNRIKIDAEFSRLIIGMSSIAMTGISMLSYVFDWKSKEVAHKQAFKSLLELKNMWQQFSLKKESATIKGLYDIKEKSSLIMSQFVAIDNAVFNKFKKRHYMKVYISKNISYYPFVPLFLIKLWSMKRDCKEVRKIIFDEQSVKTTGTNHAQETAC